MSIIPLLISCYLITVKFFSWSLLTGIDGIYFLLALIMALLGLLVGRQLLDHVVQQLIASNEQLARVNTRQGEFVSHVAHEFRAPLAIVKGALDNLHDGLYGPLSPEQLEPVAISQTEANRLKRIVGDLLDLGQLESGKLSLQKAELVLQDVVRSVAAACQGLLKTRGLTLELDLPPAPVTLQADRDRISQVFINLLTNAIKFTDHGGVRVSLQRHDTCVRLEVADTGRGIAAQDLHRIFQHFERVGAADREGSGLGLPIAKAIVELHGGRIWVLSEPGKGSWFFVELPLR